MRTVIECSSGERGRTSGAPFTLDREPGKKKVPISKEREKYRLPFPLTKKEKGYPPLSFRPATNTGKKGKKGLFLSTHMRGKEKIAEGLQRTGEAEFNPIPNPNPHKE